MPDDFPYLGELTGWGDKSRPAMFIHKGDKYQVEILYQAKSEIAGFKELFGPESVTPLQQGGYGFSPEAMVIPQHLMFRTTSPRKAFILHPSGENHVSWEILGSSSTVVLGIDQFIQVPIGLSDGQIDTFLSSLHAISFTSDYLRKWLGSAIAFYKWDAESRHLDIPTTPDERTLAIEQAHNRLTLNFQTQRSLSFQHNSITVRALSNSFIASEDEQTLDILQQAELSVIQLLCLAYGRRITISNVRVAASLTGANSLLLHAPRFHQFERADTHSEEQLPRPLFSFSDIVHDGENGLQKWFDMEGSKGNTGLHALISAIAFSDRVPLEDQIMDCCNAASSLKVNVRDPHMKEPGLRTTIFYLCADVLGLPEANMIDSQQAENNSPEAHHTYCWSKSIADYNNSLKHGDYKRETQQDVTIIQDGQTALGYLIEFKLMLRFWVALHLGCTRKLLQDYLRNKIHYHSPLDHSPRDHNSLFAPWLANTTEQGTHEEKQDELTNEPDEAATRNQSTQQIGQPDDTDRTDQLGKTE